MPERQEQLWSVPWKADAWPQYPDDYHRPASRIRVRSEREALANDVLSAAEVATPREVSQNDVIGAFRVILVRKRPAERRGYTQYREIAARCVSGIDGF
ncbi:MAG: hypothetical protein AMXMBFR57_08300 [Acidimicrobiia bacterium]